MDKKAEIYTPEQFIKAIRAIFNNYPENYTGGIYNGGNNNAKPDLLKATNKKTITIKNNINTEYIINII